MANSAFTPLESGAKGVTHKQGDGQASLNKELLRIRDPELLVIEYSIHLFNV
jgi:hypothetical protein